MTGLSWSGTRPGKGTLRILVTHDQLQFTAYGMHDHDVTCIDRDTLVMYLCPGIDFHMVESGISYSTVEHYICMRKKLVSGLSKCSVVHIIQWLLHMYIHYPQRTRLNIHVLHAFSRCYNCIFAIGMSCTG